jgi:glutamyl-tRNA synthetase
VPPDAVDFVDAFAGSKHFKPAEELGDFVIAKADGTPAFQLAVVLDDSEMGVTDVVRGDDLLDSTPRQILLYRALRLADRIPSYLHVPLIVGPDGRRLAKRHGDSRLSFYRQRGVRPGRILALLARWCGVDAASGEISCGELLERFHLSHLPAGPITYTREEEARLWGGGSV